MYTVRWSNASCKEVQYSMSCSVQECTVCPVGGPVHASYASCTFFVDPGWRTDRSSWDFAAHSSAAAYSLTPPLQIELRHILRRLDTFRPDSSSLAGGFADNCWVPLLYRQHRSVRGKPYNFSVDPRWRPVLLSFFAVGVCPIWHGNLLMDHRENHCHV